MKLAPRAKCAECDGRALTGNTLCYECRDKQLRLCTSTYEERRKYQLSEVVDPKGQQ